jgi:threonine dehydratase
VEKEDKVGNTPIIYNEQLGCFLKLECRNPSGSHKDRETLKIIKLFGKKKHYIIASSGNAGISLAYWMQEKATVIVPEITPKPKIEKIKRYGAKVVVNGRYYSETYKIAEEIARSHGWIDISPRRVERWRGDVEISYELKNLNPDYIFVPSGNHTLARGIAQGFKEMLERSMIKNLPKVVSCTLPDHPFTKLTASVKEKYKQIFNSIYTYGEEETSMEREFLQFPFVKTESTIKLREVLELSSIFPEYDPAVWLAMYVSKEAKNIEGRKVVIVTGVKR